MKEEELLELLKEKDQRISLTEYELKLAQENIEILNKELNSTVQKSKNEKTFISNLNEEEENQRELEIDKMEKEPVKQHELKALNFILYKFLSENGYEMASIYFSQEILDQNLSDWSSVGLKKVKEPPSLASLFRYYLNVGPNKERFEQSSYQKTKELLSESLRKNESLQIKNQNLKKKVMQLEKQIKRNELDWSQKVEEVKKMQFHQSKVVIEQSSLDSPPQESLEETKEEPQNNQPQAPLVKKRRRIYQRLRKYDDLDQGDLNKDSERIQKEVSPFFLKKTFNSKTFFFFD